jgi:hypothetical protein
MKALSTVKTSRGPSKPPEAGLAVDNAVRSRLTRKMRNGAGLTSINVVFVCNVCIIHCTLHT